MATKVVNTRIQLKSDTEENWKKSVLTADNGAGTKPSGTSFIPLSGELIIFLADQTHHSPRLKVGDGKTNVLSLPFIDAGSLNGLTDILIQADARLSFPAIGNSGQLYLDKSTNNIYYWNNQRGYVQAFQFNATTINTLNTWNAGKMTMASIQNTSLVIENGTEPQLTFGQLGVVTTNNEVNLNG